MGYELWGMGYDESWGSIGHAAPALDRLRSDPAINQSVIPDLIGDESTNQPVHQ